MQPLVDRFGPLDRIIETQISKIYLFQDVAVKQYKHQSAFFGDLANPTFRKEFYREDFFWNHDVAPDIYLELIEADGDRFIVMKRILAERNLTSLLEKGEVSADDMRQLTAALVKNLRHLTAVRRDKLAHVFNVGWQKLHSEGLEDLRQFALDALIDSSTVHEIVDLLQEKSVSESYFDNDDVLSTTIDTNCDNLLFIDGHPTCIDILPVKESWRVVDEYCTILRTAVDAEALGDSRLGDVVRAVYGTFREPAPRVVTLVYEIRAGMIQWAYRLFLGQPERAVKYRQFVEGRVVQLKGF